MPIARCLRFLPLVAALVPLGACAPPTVTATPTPPTTASAAAAGPGSGAAVSAAAAGKAMTPAQAALLGRLVPYPADARPWTANRTGVFGLSQFIDEFYVTSVWTSERGLMDRRGFVRAARHGWINADGTQDDVWLIDFSGATGARSMYLGLTGTWKTGGSTTDFADAAVHGQGQSTTALDSLGNASAKVAAVSGHTVVYVKVYTAARPDRAAAASLARAQYDRVTH